jgi:hypothetical protein
MTNIGNVRIHAQTAPGRNRLTTCDRERASTDGPYRPSRQICDQVDGPHSARERSLDLKDGYEALA